MSLLTEEKNLIDKYSYVWCVFGGNKYVIGAIASAFSVKKSKTNHDLVCMYTDDVTDTELLSKAFTKIVKVDYLQYKSKDLKTKKQKDIYGSWIDKSYTKMNCLSLIEYKKILFMDADTVVLNNIDHLFQLQAPAGTFSSPWGDKYGGTIPLKMYPNLHGELVSTGSIRSAMMNGGVAVIATTLLLEPDMDVFDKYKIYLEWSQPFGFQNCNSGFDEQSITSFYAKVYGKDWVHIHQRYNFIPWKANWMNREDKAHVFHFFNKDKPWTMNPKEWPDLKIYFSVLADMINSGDYSEDEIKKYVPHLPLK